MDHSLSNPWYSSGLCGGIPSLHFQQTGTKVTHIWCLLVVTGSTPDPQEISMGLVIPRDDLKASHEEADVIMPQQMVVLANQGSSSIEVISDDTDVFILLV